MQERKDENKFKQSWHGSALQDLFHNYDHRWQGDKKSPKHPNKLQSDLSDFVC